MDRFKALLKTRNGAILAVVAGIFVVAAVSSLRGSGAIDTSSDANATFKVRRGPLTISIREAGTIKARDQIVIKSEVEGQTQIITLMPEGTVAQKGDLLVELDASSLNDNRVDQQIRVQNSEAQFINARENLEVVKSRAESDVRAAELQLQFAREDSTKYVEGDYPMEMKRALADIAVAESEMSRTQEQLAGSKRLFEEGYLTSIEYERDKQNAERATLDLELSRSALQLLEEYTYKRRLTELESDIEEKESALDRTKLSSSADVVQAEASFRAKESEFNREQTKLEKLDRQIDNTKIFAPASGLVVYATTAKGGGWRGSSEPLEEGQSVRERQELIYLPTASNMMAEINIHESNLAKTRPGMGVRITVDAVPGAEYTGHITAIAPMPDAQSAFMNPDLKVYATKVTIDGDASALRTGMNCQAEIMVEHLEDAVYVPVQSIYSVKGVTTAFLKHRSGVEQRTVVIGNDDNQMVHILEGLEVGEEVLLAPPLGLAASVSDSTSADGGAGGFVAPDESKVRTQQPQNALIESDAAGDRPRFGGEGADMSDDEGNRRRERFMNMSEEERSAMMQERMKDMTPEQQEEMKRRMEQFSQGQGGNRRPAE